MRGALRMKLLSHFFSLLCFINCIFLNVSSDCVGLCGSVGLKCLCFLIEFFGHIKLRLCVAGVTTIPLCGGHGAS